MDIRNVERIHRNREMPDIRPVHRREDETMNNTQEQETQDTTKLLCPKAGTATSSPTGLQHPPIFECCWELKKQGYAESMVETIGKQLSNIARKEEQRTHSDGKTGQNPHSENEETEDNKTDSPSGLIFRLSCRETLLFQIQL
jgi:hypothetical protein